MNDQQLLRYSRHILLNEFGVEGQERLRASAALVVGAGGLGCPAALYLASSGVGRLVIADADAVDLTNLQRQVLYRTASVGAKKVDEAKRTLAAMNADVEIVPLAQRVGADQVDTLVAGADVVLDCSDNFATRHLLNRACVRHGRPLVSGAAIRFDGQLMVFDLRRKEAPCYACLFPEDGEVEEVQCNVMGVLAPLTGTVGALQALEAVKLLAGAGETPLGQLTLIDALRSELRSVKVKKDPRCAVCGAR
ncbi:MAG: molybdopterin-synthase adenylyltransferase MoeB [Betaproteobacteria bacterium]|nr:molybdopterin-synthase adenylyltransferase MoeB [Betaproteobacteria bacterium]MDH5221081.1 molybdopterin-synthase adenylyltransferase MoeB [Betaproteobacteria bacterium]MDH5349187.1 molybdopterin-synthase adenylyltransferase MoeB [Betaproteobacteria bacterium]